MFLRLGKGTVEMKEEKTPIIRESIGKNEIERKEFGDSKEPDYPSGIKWTRQRKTVYKVLWDSVEPLNAVQIYHLAEKMAGGEEYAPSTIYRILAAFEERAFKLINEKILKRIAIMNSFFFILLPLFKY